MESKFIIFLVLVGFAKGSYVPSLPVSYGLTEEQQAVFTTVLGNQDISLFSTYDGINSFYDQIYNLVTKTDTSSDKSIEISENFVTSIESALTVVEVVLGDACPFVLENLRNETWDYFDTAVAAMNDAFELITNDYSETQAAIQAHHVVAENAWTNLVSRAYEIIYSCRDVDSDAETLIDRFKAESVNNVIRFVNAVFNAIKQYAIVNSDGSLNTALVFDLKQSQNRALVGARNNIEYFFSTYKALYIYWNSNQSGLLTSLGVIQYAQTVSFNRYREGNVVLFDTVKDNMKRIVYGLDDDGKEDYSRADAALREVIVKFDEGDKVVLNIGLTLFPDSGSAVETAHDEIYTANTAGDVAFFDAILAANAVGSNYTETIARVEDLREAATGPAPAYTALFFNVIRGNKTWDDATETELASFLTITIDGGVQATSKFLDAVEVLTNVTYQNTVTADDYSALDDLLNDAIVGLESFCHGLAQAGTTILHAISTSEAEN